MLQGSSPYILDLPHGRRGRALALGITFILLLLGWLLVSALLGLYAENESRLTEKRETLVHTRALVDSLPELESRYETTSRSLRESTPLIAETSRETALARLQQIVHDAAESVNAAPTSMELLPVMHSGRFERLGVRISVTTSYEMLVRLLDILAQSGTPRLLVEDVRIEVSEGPASPDAAIRGRPLDMSITILALRDPRPERLTAGARP